jgi:LCP family protein required for cell wall assembly
MKGTARSRKPKHKTRKRHSKTVRGLVIATISLMSFIALLCIGSGIYMWRLFSLVNYSPTESQDFVDSVPDEEENSGYEEIDDYEKIEEDAASVAEISVKGNTKNISNYLLIGVDSRKNNFSGLSDAIIILTIDKKNKDIRLTSLLRDTLVTIPGRDRNRDGKDDYSKLNAAYAYGGASLLSKTIEQNFRLKIEKHITVNFHAFSAAIDAMGGIDIQLTSAEARHIKVGSTAKKYTLNGRYALDYARIRKLDSDFGRTERQRKVIGAMFEKAKTMNVAKLNNILNKVLPQVNTNMTVNEFMSFTLNSLTYFGYTMDKTYHIPPNGKYRSAPEFGLGSVLYMEEPAAAVTELHKFIYNG